MSNPFLKKWLAAMLCMLALGSTVARAEPDSFGLGSGRNGALSVTTAGNIINSYTQVTGPLAPGDTSLPVGTCLGAVSCFSAGELVMVLQTTGIVPEPASGAAGPLDITNDAVGRWEFARLASVSGSTLTLTAPLVHSYAANVTQVIKVPEYTTVTVSSTGRIVPLPWNGSVGGVIAFLATGTVNNAGQITANATGFRGGTYLPSEEEPVAKGCEGLDEAPTRGAQKGEGIANVRYGPTHTGRGNVANGGGGGVCLKSGGGGGGNYGSGGMGGRSDGSIGTARPVGGMGGSALVYSLLNHLTPGGGGGAGQGTELTGAPGGRGGGIIFIRANQLTGTGSIQASGGGGGSSSEDGGSGGGAGGSIYLRFVDTAACGAVSANGGVGGTVNTGRVGPGGGGAGGRVLFQAATGGTCVLNLTGASPGNQQDPTAPDGITYGATAGGNGIPTLLTGGFVVPPTPTVSTPANGSFTNNRRPVITGTARPSTTVIIYIDGVEAGRATSDAAGNYSFTPTVDLSEASHTVQAATEVEAVQSPRSAANTFTVDLTPPETKIDSGPSSPTNATSATFPFSYVGTEPGPVTYQCKLDTEPDFTACPNPKTYTGLGEGSHILFVRAVDAAGNVDPTPARYDWTVDTTAPNTVIESGPPAVTSLTSATFDFSSPEAGVTFECKRDTETTFTACSDPVTFNNVGEGTHTLEVRARDAAGNVDPTPATYTWRVDTTAPTAPVVSGPLEGATLDTLTPAITGTAEPGSTVTVIIDGQEVGTVKADASGNWSYTPTTPLTVGPHEVKVRSTDEAGNTSPVSPGRTFTIVQDTQAPETTISSGPSGTTPERGATFEFTSNEPGVTYECSLDGAAFTPCTSPVTFTNLAEGEHTFQVRARDAAGNVDATPDTRTWTVRNEDTGNGGGDISFRGDGFGCSATGGDSALVLMGLGTFLALARRRRR
jgi:uncharacterized protein (TIGR03382 family)